MVAKKNNKQKIPQMITTHKSSTKTLQEKRVLGKIIYFEGCRNNCIAVFTLSLKKGEHCGNPFFFL